MTAPPIINFTSAPLRSRLPTPAPRVPPRRAVALFEKREQERLAAAQEALYRQWREGCDGVRATESAVITLTCAADRKQQMVERLGRKMTEAEEARFWHELNEKERLRKEERHVSDVEAMKRRMEAVSFARGSQLEELAERRRMEADEAARDSEEMKQRWEAEQAAADEAARAAADEAARVAADLKDFNANRRANVDAAAQAEKALDQELLRRAMEKAAAEDERDRLIREAKRQGDDVYRAHLAMLARQAREEEKERERLIAEYNAEQADIADAKRAKEEAARQRLQQQVVAGNRQQMEEHAAAKAGAAAAKAAERQQYEMDRRTMGEAAAKAASAQRAAVFLRKAELEAQIRAKEERRDADEAARQAELEQQRQQEALYQAMLERERAAIVQKGAAPDFRRRKNNWME